MQESGHRFLNKLFVSPHSVVARGFKLSFNADHAAWIYQNSSSSLTLLVPIQCWICRTGLSYMGAAFCIEYQLDRYPAPFTKSLILTIVLQDPQQLSFWTLNHVEFLSFNDSNHSEYPACIYLLESAPRWRFWMVF